MPRVAQGGQHWRQSISAGRARSTRETRSKRLHGPSIRDRLRPGWRRFPPWLDIIDSTKGKRRNNDECAKTGSISCLHDDRGDTRVCGRLDAGRASRSGICRRRRSHQRATAGCSGCRSTRTRVRPGADRSASTCAARGRYSPSEPRGADAGQRRDADVHRRRQVGCGSRAPKVRVAVTAAASSTQRGGDLHTDSAAHGAQARGIRRDSKGRQHRFALSRRFDHRLVGPGRREHGDVPEVLR